MKTQLPIETLNAYLDGELPSAERKAFRKLLEEHPEWLDEVGQIISVHRALGSIRVKPPDPQIWDNYWEEIDARLPKQASWSVLLIGGILLIVIGVIKIWLIVGPATKIGFALIILGLLMQLVLVLRGRMIEFPKDRYKKVRR